MSRQKDLGRALENRVRDKAQAAGLDSKRHFGSGMNPDEPSDVRIERLLVECKVRSSKMNAKGEKSMTVPLDDYRKVQRQALEAGYEQGIMVANPKGSSQPIVLCDLDWFLEVLTKALR
jgi:hypothetical protein